MKKNLSILFLALISILILFFLPYKFTKISLNGSKEVYINYQDNYVEQNAKASFLKTALKVKIIGQVDTKKLGKTVIKYQVKNKLGIIKSIKRTIYVVDKVPPVIILKGNEKMNIEVNSWYDEPGFTMTDNVDGNITNKVITSSNLDTSKIGTYEILYKGMDSSKNIVTAKRIINVVAKEISYQDIYNTIDNTPKTWWSGNKKDNTRPLTGGAAIPSDLKQYNAYYLGEDKKIIYLTYDEGDNKTYLNEIVDVLNKMQVKATFFLCNNFISSNPTLINKIVNSGHSVGNHTVTHQSMYNFANQSNFKTFLNEIRKVEQTFYAVTGKQMDKIYREPRGDWSYRDLQILKDMGYKTFFWSASYLDYEENVSKEEALKNYMRLYHNGAIFLLHPKNKGNFEALEDFIKNMKALGYDFGLVKDIKS